MTTEDISRIDITITIGVGRAAHSPQWHIAMPSGGASTPSTEPLLSNKAQKVLAFQGT